MTRGPTIVRVAPGGGGGGGKGIKCCCCRCCECLNLGYLTSHHGIIKVAESVSTSIIIKVNLSLSSSGRRPGGNHELVLQCNSVIVLRKPHFFVNRRAVFIISSSG